MYTYNRSTNVILDEDYNEIRDYDTTYNYDDRQDKWEEDKSSWETVELYARAYGGRPEPIIKWYVDNNNDELNQDDHFRISEGRIGCQDRNSLICDYESRIEFTVDDELMEILSDEYGVDTNPKDGLVRFDLTIEVEQGDDQSYVDTQKVSMNIEKTYDNGSLPASTIGIIVGVTVAVVILVVALILLFYAKRRRKWCFKASLDTLSRRRRI